MASTRLSPQGVARSRCGLAGSPVRTAAATSAVIALAFAGTGLGAGVASAQEADAQASTQAQAGAANPLGSLGDALPAAPSGSLDAGLLGEGMQSGSAGQLEAGSAAGAQAGSAAALQSGLGSQSGSAGAAMSTQPTAAPQTTTYAQSQNVQSGYAQNTYADTQLAPGTFNPDALGQLSPETIGVVGTAGAASIVAGALSLGPLGPSTASATIAGLIPGVAYVPGAGSLASAGSGEFTTSVGFTVAENTIIRTLGGFALTGSAGYFETMADKQEAGELTESDIETWDRVMRSIDELRAVFSLPPILRSDPHEQKPIPEPCRRNYPKKHDVSQDEADALCEQAQAEEAAKTSEATGTETTSPSATTNPATSPAATGESATSASVDGEKPAAPKAERVANSAPSAVPTGAGEARAAATPVPGAQLAAEPESEQLAFTGVEAGVIGLGAVAFIGVGGALLFLGRRKAHAE